MPRQTAKQALQTEPRNQQRAQTPRRCRKSLQSDHKQKTKRNGRPRTQLRQFKFATAEGTIGRVEFLGGFVSE